MNLVDDVDIDVRKMASVALVIIGAWVGISAVLVVDGAPHVVNAVMVSVGLVVCALLGRRGVRGAFPACIALASWLLLSTWMTSGRSPGIVISHFIAAALAFGFACVAVAPPPPERRVRS